MTQLGFDEVAAILAEQLEQVIVGASGDRQWGAAGSAAGLKAKLLGFMREKIEIGSAGQFDECKSTEDVIEALLAQEPAAELLASIDSFRAQIERHAADHAQLVPSAEPARSRPDEVGLALGYLRRRR
jgi:hypothetical protein